MPVRSACVSRQFVAFYKLWFNYSEQEAEEQWKNDRATKKGEVEDGEYKIWVREPTKTRGHTLTDVTVCS